MDLRQAREHYSDSVSGESLEAAQKAIQVEEHIQNIHANKGSSGQETDIAIPLRLDPTTALLGASYGISFTETWCQIRESNSGFHSLRSFLH